VNKSQTGWIKVLVNISQTGWIKVLVNKSQTGWIKVLVNKSQTGWIKVGMIVRVGNKVFNRWQKLFRRVLCVRDIDKCIHMKVYMFIYITRNTAITKYVHNADMINMITILIATCYSHNHRRPAPVPLTVADLEVSKRGEREA
jgi:hypothetical protein